MKVILLKDIARIGKRFEVKSVPDGHALNFLIPKKLVEPASSENLKRLEKQKERSQGAVEAKEDAFNTVLEKVSGATIKMLVEANEQAHLFSGIKAEDISVRLSEEFGEVDASQVLLTAPIKELGAHEITLSCGEKSGKFTLTLVKK